MLQFIKNIDSLRFSFINFVGNSRNAQLVCSEDGPDSKNKPKSTKRSPTDLPKCDTGCVETLFGLKNIFSSSEDLFSFLKVFSISNVGYQIYIPFHLHNTHSHLLNLKVNLNLHIIFIGFRFLILTYYTTLVSVA